VWLTVSERARGSGLRRGRVPRIRRTLWSGGTALIIVISAAFGWRHSTGSCLETGKMQRRIDLD
jgi:hypothetical protein